MNEELRRRAQDELNNILIRKNVNLNLSKNKETRTNKRKEYSINLRALI